MTPLQAKRLDKLAILIKQLPHERQQIIMSTLNEGLTVAEVAEVCGVHAETVRRWVRAGDIQAAKIGHEYRISKTELARYWADKGGGDLFARTDTTPEPLDAIALWERAYTAAAEGKPELAEALRAEAEKGGKLDAIRDAMRTLIKDTAAAAMDDQGAGDE